MENKWGDYISQMKQAYFAGRTTEKELFVQYLKDSHPAKKILYIWGPGGTGKSTLLDEFSRLAESENAYYIRIDSRDFPHTPQGFLQRILSLLNRTPSFDTVKEGITALHNLAKNKKVVLALDTYEEMHDMDEWLRNYFFGELSDAFLVVMAGRFPLEGNWLHPIWRSLVKSIPLGFFDLETTQEYVCNFSQHNEAHIKRLFTISKGHPLTLSLIIGLSEEELSSDSAVDLNNVLRKAAKRWLRETSSDRSLQELIEVAAMVRVFNQETLEQMLQRKVTIEDFDKLVSLSFIRSSKRGWFVHDLLRPILNQEFKRRKPTIHRTLMERAINYLHQLMEQCSSQIEKTLVALDMVFLLEDHTLRSIFLTETSESGYYISPISENQLSKSKEYMAQVLSSKLDVYQEFFDPKTHQRYVSVMPFRYIENAYKLLELDEIIQLGDDVIYLVHNEHHLPVSMIIMIPIHQKSLSLLQKSPVSRNYFKNLSKVDLEQLQTKSHQPAGWFFYHIDQWMDHSLPARTALFQFLMWNLMKPGIFIHSSPLQLHQDTVVNLGFVEVPGAEHNDYGSEFPSRTYQLDLRGGRYKTFMEKLIKGEEDPIKPSHSLPSDHKKLLTPRENEIVEWVLKGLTNVEIAKNLFLSEITIKKHLGSIYEKLGVKGKAQLIKKILSSEN